MSFESKKKIKCPACGKESEFTIWQSINTDIDPQMYDAVRDGSAFRFVCPHCGGEADVNYGFLYHQMEDRIMIHYVTTDEDEKYAVENYGSVHEKSSAFHIAMPDDYLIRVVRSRNELIEKLAIFDAGLDDRVIEIIKVLFLLQMEQQNPSVKPGEVLMYNNADGKHMLAFFEEGTPLAEAEITDDIYITVRRQAEANLSDMRKGDIKIDREWALSHLGD